MVWIVVMPLWRLKDMPPVRFRNDNDLWSINTMGFRGEALPSIASVSRVLLSTNDTKEATSVVIEYGQTIAVKPYYCPEGTQIVVEDLFQKTPARLKHLKSRQYEAAIISRNIEKVCVEPSRHRFYLY